MSRIKVNDINKAVRIKLFDKYADLVYTTQPDLMRVLPERTKYRQLTKLHIGDFEPSYSDYEKEILTIVHAPSSRKAKGTDIIIDVVEKLITNGYSIRFQLIENMPNEEALSKYKNADIVIDQILVGWYGGFAVECMAYGKPVAVYIRETDMKYIPAEQYADMPFIKVTPNTLYDELVKYIENRDLLKEKAVKSREYVVKWHDNEKIVKDIVEDYKKIYVNKKLIKLFMWK